MKDVVHEQTIGANVKYGFGPGSWIGVSAYESDFGLCRIVTTQMATV